MPQYLASKDCHELDCHPETQSPNLAHRCLCSVCTCVCVCVLLSFNNFTYQLNSLELEWLSGPIPSSHVASNLSLDRWWLPSRGLICEPVDAKFATQLSPLWLCPWPHSFHLSGFALPPEPPVLANTLGCFTNTDHVKDFFFFWLHLQHVEVPRPGIKPVLMLWPAL